jgi:hypothetical protein
LAGSDGEVDTEQLAVIGISRYSWTAPKPRDATAVYGALLALLQNGQSLIRYSSQSREDVKEFKVFISTSIC